MDKSGCIYSMYNYYTNADCIHVHMNLFHFFPVSLTSESHLRIQQSCPEYDEYIVYIHVPKCTIIIAMGLNVHGFMISNILRAKLS